MASFRAARAAGTCARAAGGTALTAGAALRIRWVCSRFSVSPKGSPLRIPDRGRTPDASAARRTAAPATRRAEPSSHGMPALQRTAGNAAAVRALRQDGALPVQRMQKFFGGLKAPAKAANGPTPEQLRGRLRKIVGGHSPQEEPTQQTAHAWGSELDAVEHELYAWFGRSPAAGAEERKRAAEVADEVQAEHHRYTRFLIEHRLEPYMARLAPGEEAGARGTWAELSANRGVHVADSGENEVATDDAFRTGVHSMNARLMSRPHGRTLLGALLAGAGDTPQVTVKPIDIDRMKRMGTAMEVEDYHEVAQTGAVDGHGHAHPANATAGTPSRSEMHFEPGLQDSAAGLDPVSPAFVAYGHELVHALHDKHGVNLKNFTEPDTMVEEHETVGLDSGNPAASALLMNTLMQHHITEADLRKEHGIPARTAY